MPFKTLKQKMAEGQEVRVMAVSAFPSPKFIEVAGKFGELDGVWIDQEHSGLPNQKLELLLMACRAAGLDAFARVAPTDYATVMRPMEGVASGVMMAQVRSVPEVEKLVRWMKYHPVGERGLFLGSYEAELGAKPAPQHVGGHVRALELRCERRDVVLVRRRPPPNCATPGAHTMSSRAALSRSSRTRSRT